MMRIITGSARGTHLYTLEGDATRPTSERAKEALFSMLQDAVRNARVLDLFAGSGQLGLEALSRGAAHAVFVDGAKKAVEIVRRNAERTHLQDKARIVSADALAFLRGCREQPFDLVFLDPPYASDLLEQVLTKVEPLVNDGGIIVCETNESTKLPMRLGRFYLAKSSRFGQAYIRIYRYNNGEEDAE